VTNIYQVIVGDFVELRSVLLLLSNIAVAAFAVGCAHRPPASGRSTSQTAASLSSAETQPAIPDPTAADPVMAAAWISPGTVSPGSSTELHVLIRVAGGFYLHPADAKAPFVATSVDMQPSDVLRPSGNWTWVRGLDAGGRLSGLIELRSRLILIVGASPERHEVTCFLRFQACNPELCWPPRVLELHAPYVVSAAR
jgi:hypothetical protein